MATTRKKALKRLSSLAARVEEHISMITANPGNQAVSHWRGEVNGWIRQMQAALPHVGKRSGAEWTAAIAVWQSQLER